MSTTTGKHAATWTFEASIRDAELNGTPGTGEHRGNLIHAFRKHLAKRFGK